MEEQLHLIKNWSGNELEQVTDWSCLWYIVML